MKLFSFLKKKPKIVVVLGPTATGKTSLSIELAKRFDGEVISADSRQVYQGLDIGTAKVTEKEMNGIPHHMLDVADPKERYTVKEFIDQAQEKIKDILSQEKLPIVCGGTGMYIDALVSGQSFPEVPANPKLREELKEMKTWELFEELQKKDPHRAKNIDPHNKIRLVRALEVVDTLGSVPKQKTSSRYKVLFIGLDLNKETLHQRIHERILNRIKSEDMLGEAKRLHKAGLSYNRMEELGLEYRYMARYLQGKLSCGEMVEELCVATRQFAKRQRTWFRRNEKIQWFNPQTDREEILQSVQDFLK